MNAPISQEEMLAVLAERAARLMENVEKSEKARNASNGRLLAEIANLLDKGRVNEISAGEWADHELAWAAYVAWLRCELVVGTSKIMLAFEAMARHQPDEITPEIAQELHWWREEGGRESFLGELPIETRRALEEEARRLPKKRVD